MHVGILYFAGYINRTNIPTTFFIPEPKPINKTEPLPNKQTQLKYVAPTATLVPVVPVVESDWNETFPVYDDVPKDIYKTNWWMSAAFLEWLVVSYIVWSSTIKTSYIAILQSNLVRNIRYGSTSLLAYPARALGDGSSVIANAYRPVLVVSVFVFKIFYNIRTTLIHAMCTVVDRCVHSNYMAATFNDFNFAYFTKRAILVATVSSCVLLYCFFCFLFQGFKTQRN